LDIKDKELLW